MWPCWDMQKTKVSQGPKTCRKVCSKKDLPMEKEQFKEHVNKLEMRGLAEVVPEPLSIFESLG